MHSVKMMNKKAGIYIHIPFCKRKCPYCDFYSVVGCDIRKTDYVNALISHIKSYKDKYISADTVYFGGGTPTALSANQLCEILNAVRESFCLTEDCEITTEANPCTVDYDYLKTLRENGFNRISFGVQSAQDSELQLLGRLHSFDTACKAVHDAVKAGFDNISCDLMIGIPGQTVDSLCDSVDKLSQLGVSHISAYMLKIEEGTAFDCDSIRSSVADEDLSADMYLAAVDRLSKHGFEQYEISNFCKDDKRSRHNMKYWKLDDYIGFGPCAHSYFEGKRFYYDRSLEQYVSNQYSSQLVEDNSPDKLYEYVMLSLRLSDGISKETYISLGGNEKQFDKNANMLVNASLAEFTDIGIALTPRGFLLSNSIILKFLE